MANREGTQEFLAAHKDHKTSMSLIETHDARYITEIVEINGHLYAETIEKDAEEILEVTAAYLYCHDCNVEEELNLGEVIED